MSEDNSIYQLPETFFKLMNEGEELAKKGDFEKAKKCFEEAVHESYKVSKFFLIRASKKYDDDKQIDDIALILVWLLKVVKSEFFVELSEYNSKYKSSEDKMNAFKHLMIAKGIQKIGFHILSLLKDYISEHGFKVHFAIHDMLEILSDNLKNREVLLNKILEQDFNMPE